MALWLVYLIPLYTRSNLFLRAIYISILARIALKQEVKMEVVEETSHNSFWPLHPHLLLSTLYLSPPWPEVFQICRDFSPQNSQLVETVIGNLGIWNVNRPGGSRLEKAVLPFWPLLRFSSFLKCVMFSATLKRSRIKPKPHPLSNCINSFAGQRTGAYLGMECDNNNDIGNASVKVLDNKVCSEARLPGEWLSAEHELWREVGGQFFIYPSSALNPATTWELSAINHSTYLLELYRLGKWIGRRMLFLCGIFLIFKTALSCLPPLPTST